MLGTDPLKIYYLLILGSSDPSHVTAFQGYSPSWSHLHWALRTVSSLPGDVLERCSRIQDINAQRMGDMRSLYWLPVDVDALEALTAEEVGPFIVCFSGELDVGKRVEAWLKNQERPILHVTTTEIDGACSFENFDDQKLQEYCLTALAANQDTLSQARRTAAEECIPRWTKENTKPSGITRNGHNVLLPNHMSLDRAGRSLIDGEPFVGINEREYTNSILESAEAVLQTREDTGIRPFHLLSLMSPGLILAEPSFIRPYYKRSNSKLRQEDNAASKALRRLQTQTGLHNKITKQDFMDFQNSDLAHSIVHARQTELQTFTLGIGLKAAQTCSAVIRLSPAVNHVFTKLSDYARNIRSPKHEARRKSQRLFQIIQSDLKLAVGDERISFIEKEGGPIKIISDAPVELLPIGNLPLGIKYNCSRINATPGNLMMGQLTNSATVTFHPDDLRKILVVSSFAEDDPLKTTLVDAIKTVMPSWKKNEDLTFAFVRDRKEFVEAINAFDGRIIVFDGHGAHNANDPISKIILGSEPIDVWSMRSEVRLPPIVILSACDTHGIDASTPATAANGFLALGARTVLATLLPVGGEESAAFIARLVFRIVRFPPAALADYKRVINWTEVIGGMLRMMLATEILDQLVDPPTGKSELRIKLHNRVNLDINTGNDNWYENLLAGIASGKNEHRARTDAKANAVLARSEAIRYIQLGNPESILIDDGSIRERILTEYGINQSIYP